MDLNIDKQEKNKQEYENEKSFDGKGDKQFEEKEDKNKAKESFNNLSVSAISTTTGIDVENNVTSLSPVVKNELYDQSTNDPKKLDVRPQNENDITYNNATSTSPAVKNDQPYDQPTNSPKKPNVQPQENIYNEATSTSTAVKNDQPYDQSTNNPKQLNVRSHNEDYDTYNNATLTSPTVENDQPYDQSHDQSTSDPKKPNVQPQENIYNGATSTSPAVKNDQPYDQSTNIPKKSKKSNVISQNEDGITYNNATLTWPTVENDQSYDKSTNDPEKPDDKKKGKSIVPKQEGSVSFHAKDPTDFNKEKSLDNERVTLNKHTETTTDPIQARLNQNATHEGNLNIEQADKPSKKKRNTKVKKNKVPHHITTIHKEIPRKNH